MKLHLGQRLTILALFCLISWNSLSAEEESSTAKPDPKTPQPPAAADSLDVQIDKAIATTSRRKLTAGVHTPWQIMHGILALRHDFYLNKSRDSKPDDTIKAIEWMGSGALHDGQTLFERTQFGGRARPYTKPYAFEGHPNQFFGIFVMSDLEKAYKFKAGENEVSIADMIENAKMDVTQGPEITWTLWALSHYLPTDSQWHNRYGQPWSIERMVSIQTQESVISAPCGGTHGLFALAYSRNKHLAEGKPLRGVWMESDQKIQRFIEEARVLQNSDGSFSTEYFRGRGFSNDFNTRIAHSGHMLEWLMMALPQSRLKDPWVRKGLDRLATDLVENRKEAAECGPLYHALHALILYRLRTRPTLYGPDKPTLLVEAKPKTNETPATPASDPQSKDSQENPAEKQTQKPADAPQEVVKAPVTPVAAEAVEKALPLAPAEPDEQSPAK